MRRQQPLQTLLFRFTSAVAISATVITAAVLYAAHIKQDEGELRQNLELAARLLGQSEASTPNRILATLDSYPLIALACLYTVTGELVSTHAQQPTASSQCPSRLVEASAGNQIPITVTIGSADRPLGALQAYATPRPGYTRLLEIAGPLILTLITLIAIVLVASRYIASATRQRRAAEVAEHDSRALLTRLVDLVPYLIFAIHKNGHVLFANQAVAELYNTTVDALLDPQFGATYPTHEHDGLVFAPFSTAAQQEEAWHTDAHTGETQRFLVTRVPYQSDDSALVIGIDVTQEHRLQLQLQFSQRLEVIGTLAGGIAHDFNNLLTPILGYTSMLIDSDLPDDARKKLRFVESAAERARDVVHQILTFSRQQQAVPRRELLDPASVVGDAAQLMRASIPSGISLVEDNQPVGQVRVDPSQLHQVIVNLCTNAAHAIGTAVGTINLRVFEVSPDSGLVPARLAPASYACIEVSDNGKGMTSDVVSHIFEPFFTTKEVGQGTGLGLSVVHGIVTAHGGDITVESAAGTGSTFRILLPFAMQPSATEPPATPALNSAGQRVLLVDDDESVLGVIAELLGHHGYQVTAMTDPTDALNAIKTNPSAFDVIVTDHNMPAMTGPELATSARTVRPDIPVILITGFAEVAGTDLDDIDHQLEKPISGRELNLAIRNGLSARRSAA